MRSPTGTSSPKPTGVLLARGETSQREAFLALTAAAREAGRPVRDVAGALLAAFTIANGTTSPGWQTPR